MSCTFSCCLWSFSQLLTVLKTLSTFLGSILYFFVSLPVFIFFSLSDSEFRYYFPPKTPFLTVLPHCPTKFEFGVPPVCFQKPHRFLPQYSTLNNILALVCKGLSLSSVHSIVPTSCHTAQYIFVEVNLNWIIVCILETFPLNLCFNHIVFSILHRYN